MTEPAKTFRRVRFPLLTTVLLAAHVVGFFIEMKQGTRLPEFLNTFSFVPAQMLAYFRQMPGTSFTRSALPFLATLFFHAGFLHLVINTSYLWLVGEVMEAFLGHVRFMLLWVAGAVTWGVVVLLTTSGPASGLPCLGSGGVIAALLGAYLSVYRRLLRLSRGPARPRLVTFGTPIAILALLWIPLQLLTRHSELVTSLHSEYGPPWLAILGSFVVGVLLAQLLLPMAPTTSEAVARPVMPGQTSEAAEAGLVGSTDVTDTVLGSGETV